MVPPATLAAPAPVAATALVGPARAFADFASVSAELKALIDRTGLVAMANDSMFRRKAGAAVVAVRRGGAVCAFDSINHFFLISQMLVVGSRYWNFGFGRNPGDVAEDEEGLETMKVLGENMAWTLGKLNA